jgi:hypothetical protein
MAQLSDGAIVEGMGAEAEMDAADGADWGQRARGGLQPGELESQERAMIWLAYIIVGVTFACFTLAMLGEIRRLERELERERER